MITEAETHLENAKRLQHFQSSAAEDLGVLLLLMLKASNAAVRLEKRAWAKHKTEQMSLARSCLSMWLCYQCLEPAPVQSLMYSPASPGFPPLSGHSTFTSFTSSVEAATGKRKRYGLACYRKMTSVSTASLGSTQTRTSSSVVWYKVSTLCALCCKVFHETAWCLLNLKVIKVLCLVCFISLTC